MSDGYVRALRRELVEAAAREQARAHRRIPRPRPRVALAAAAAAALLVLVALAAQALVGREGATPADRRAKPVQRGPRALFGGSLDPGVRYRTTALRPALTLSVGDDRWFARSTDSPDGLLLERRRGYERSGAERPPHAWLFAGRLAQVIDPASARAVRAPRDLLGWLRAHPDLRVDGTSTTTVAGRRADVLDTTVAFATPVRHGRQCEQPFVSPFARPGAPVSCTTLAPGVEAPRGMHIRFIAVRGVRPSLLLTVEGWPERDYRRTLGPAMRVIAGLRIAR